MRVTSCGVIMDYIKLLYVHCVYYLASALFFSTASLASASSYTTYVFHSLAVIPYTVDNYSDIENLLLVSHSSGFIFSSLIHHAATVSWKYHRVLTTVTCSGDFVVIKT
jgi:hypothetical protein